MHDDIIELLRPHVRRIFEAGLAKGRAEAGHSPLPAVEEVPPFADPDPDAEAQEAADRENHPHVSPHFPAMLGAMLDHAIAAAEGGRWMGAGLDALTALLDRPERLGKVAKGLYRPRYTKGDRALFEKAVMATPRKRAEGEVWESRNHPGMWFTARTIGGKLRTVRTKKPGGDHPGLGLASAGDAAHAELTARRTDALARVKEIRQLAARGDISADHLRELAGHLEHLTVPELYTTRQLLSIQHDDATAKQVFGGKRSGAEMRAAFAAYARDKATGLDTPEDMRSDAERIEQDLDPASRESLRPDRTPRPEKPVPGQGDDPTREQSLEEMATGAGDDFRFGGGRRASHRDPFSPSRERLGNPDTSRPGWNAPVTRPVAEPDIAEADDLEPEPPGWTPENHVKLVADNPKKIRKQDVGRLFEQAPPGKANELAEYLARVRPGLADEIADALADTGDKADDGYTDDEIKQRAGEAIASGRITADDIHAALGHDSEDEPVPAAGAKKGGGAAGKVPPHPTHHLPGTPEKSAVMAERVARGEHPHHPDDAKVGGAAPKSVPAAAAQDDEVDDELPVYDHAAELARRRAKLEARRAATPEPVAEESAVPEPELRQPDDATGELATISGTEASQEADTALARPAGSGVAKAGAGLPPNTVIMAVRDQYGNLLGRLSAPHDGTVEGIKEAAEEVKNRAHEEYPEFSNIASKTGATDHTGDPRHVVSPNRAHVADISTEEGRYIFGILPGPQEEVPALPPARDHAAEVAGLPLAGGNRSLVERQLAAAETPAEKDAVVDAARAASGQAAALPHVALATALAAKLRDGETVTAKDLWAEANRAYGGTRAEGKYGPSDAYDALEAGFNRALAGATDPTAGLSEAQAQARELAAKVDALPTQTNRSGNKDAFQQFSTPPHYAFAAAWAANLKPGEHVLEPSAGTGSLATQVRNAGAEVHANELDPRRADFLRDQFGRVRVHGENAEQIAGILPGRGVRPTAVVMNPPFSQTAGRLGNKKDLMVGANHIAEALKVLAPGGRLVAIVGRGMAPDSPTYRDWFDEIRGKYSLRANVGVAGDEYKKYGTAFGTRLLVIDKTGPHSGETVVGDAADVPDLMAKLEGVRDDRPGATELTSGVPVGGASPGVARGAGGPAGVPPAGPGAGVPGGVGGGLSVQPVLGGVGAGGGSPDAADAGVGGVADGAQPRGTGKRPRGKAGAGSGVAGAGVPSGAVAGGSGAGGDAAAGRKGARGKSVQRPGTDVPVLRPAEPVGVGSEPDEVVSPAGSGEEKTHAELGDSLYESYRPALLRVPGAKAHPTPLVESAAMSAVAPPAPAYRPVLSPDIVSGGKKVTHRTKDGTVETQDVGLSEVQLESLVYAGQAHSKFLPGGGGTPLTDGMQLAHPGGETFKLVKDAKSGVWGLDGTPHTFADDHEARRFLAGEGFRTVNGHPVIHDAPVRRGYFIGDGTGVGKGRQIAGVMTDNWNQGRKKHVWVSQKQSLYEDAQRDWRGLGNDPRHVHHFDDIREALAAGKAGPEEGVGFITYDTLKGAPKDKAKASNLDMLAKWLGPDFDGVIAFDEAHGMGNALNTEGGRGMKEASQKALAGVRLQQMFPKARVLYVSATGATEVSNLAYAERLGLWGRGTPFPTKQDFIEKMNEGGVAAMEAVAQSLKAMGGYTARSLSFDDGTPEGKVTYERLTHSLTPDQHAMYDAAADGWQHVLRHIDKALEATGAKDNPNAKSAALSQFWGAQQRFFNQVMTSMQTPSVIRGMEEDIKAGRAPVVQLVNTMEAALKRAKSRLDADDADAVEDMDVSPKEVLMQYLERSFPTTRYETRVDADGNETSVPVRAPVMDENNQPVTGSDGKPVMRDVEDPEAVAMRDELMAMVGTLRIPESPLDMIVNHFGHEHVAECTGRGERVVYQDQPDGSRRKVFETRGATANSSEARAFQDGRKKVLIFSDAGGTGRSYHADKNAKNQNQRVHYMLQPGWRADNAVQGLGRTHRTNQAVAPTYRLVEIDQLKAQKRFISTIARRLDQLGALTKGQRQAGSAGLFKAADNLESPEAREALVHFFNDLHKNQIPGLDFHDVMAQLGFEEPKEKEGRRNRNKPAMGAGDVPPMGQFLNRLLSLRVELQGKVFDAYEDRLKRQVERAVLAGTLNAGVENYPAERLSKKADVSVHKDADTGAEARLFVATARRKANKRPWQSTKEGELPLSFVRNKQSGRVWAVYKANDTTDTRTGNVIPTVRLKSPTGSDGYRPAHEIPDKSPYGSGYSYSDKYERLDEEAAQKLWEKEHGETPDYYEQDEHFVTGAFLPIWDRIPGDKPRIYRLRTEDGTTVVGRHVTKDHVPTLLRNLGVTLEGGGGDKHTPETTHAALAAGRSEAKLANGWFLKPVRVQGERRIEVRGVGPAHMREIEQDGVMRERVGYDTRFFVPVGPAGVEVLRRITAARPITEVNPLASGV